mmetsp:Transcript_19826/g.61903  ORF Transcript_19826/g.61903 Transcript_19826/m.61903 type:complete len:396 (-) Transcript_19826:545-1732(-)
MVGDEREAHTRARVALVIIRVPSAAHMRSHRSRESSRATAKRRAGGKRGTGRHGGADPSSSRGPARGQSHYAASGPVSDKLPRPRLDELRTVHDVESGGRGDGGDVMLRVKGRVQDAPRKVGRQIGGRVQRRRARPAVRSLRRLEREVRRGAVGGEEVEAVLVRAGEDVRRIVVEAALELVEYAVLLVEVAQLRPQVLVHRYRLYRPRLYPHIPDAHGEVVARDDVAPVSREARGGDGGGDLREEGLGGRVLRLLERLCAGVAEGGGAHVAEADAAARGGVEEGVAVDRVEVGRREDLGERLHVCRLDVDYVEAALSVSQVPQVEPQVVAGEERLAVGAERHRVYVVRVRVRKGSLRRRRDDALAGRHQWEAEAPAPHHRGRAARAPVARLDVHV